VLEIATATLATPRLKFSAVILAGGRSTRMGQDKATLPLDGQPLLARQIAFAKSLGPVEILISGRPEVDYTPFDCPVLMDRVQNAGPLAGIAVALEAARAPLVLVLAVDMPYLTRAAVERLMNACRPDRGAVPRFRDRLEPLVAIYPRAAVSVANQQLAEGYLAVRDFAIRCQEAGLVCLLDLEPELDGVFRSWNSPADINTGPAVQPSETAWQPDAVCELCGCTGAYTLGQSHICSDCYHASSSCCPEFGAWDGWTAADDSGGQTA